MATNYKVSLAKEDATVEIDGKTYKNGDSITLPAGLTPDVEFSKFSRRPAFRYETTRQTRDVSTGAKTTERDVKRVLLPIVEA